MILSAANRVKPSIASPVIAEMTLSRCSQPTLMGTIQILTDSILTLAPTTQYYAKTQPNLNVFDE